MTTINKLCIKSSYLRICLWQNTSAIIPHSIYVIGLISIMCQCYMFTLTEYAYVGQCAIHFVCLLYGISNSHLNPVLKCIFPTGVYRVAPARGRGGGNSHLRVDSNVPPRFMGYFCCSCPTYRFQNMDILVSRNQVVLVHS